MFELWSDLAPLILISAALPLQTVVTLLLARNSLRSAYAWLTGMIVVRIVQGVLFGLVFASSEAQSDPGPRYFLGAVLLILALLLYVKAVRAAMGSEDEDAPPPKWLAKAGSMSPLVAFGAGAGFMTLSFKFLIFTLGAIGAIGEAHTGFRLSAVAFLLFVVLGHIVPLSILALASFSSSRSAATLDELMAWLGRNSRTINIVFSVIFGTWFLLKAAGHLGVG